MVTRIDQDQLKTPPFDDTKTAGAALQSGSVDSADAFDGVMSMLKTCIGLTNWYDNPTKTIEVLAGQATLEGKNILKRAQKITDIGPIAVNAQYTLLAAGEFPSHVVAIATSVKGAVTAQLAGAVGTADLAEIVGANALNPKNLAAIVDGTTGDPIVSSGRLVWALLQIGVTGVDNTAFAAAGAQQGQISFVRPNAAYDDLELVPAGDMDGKTIMYSYVYRNDMNSMSEQSFLPGTLFVDQAIVASVDMDEAYNNGSVVAVDDTNVDFRLTDTKEFIVSDSTGTVKILTVKALSGGDVVQIIGTLDMDGDIDGGNNKATFNGVEVGGAAGQIARTGGDLTLKTITSGNVHLDSVAEVQFTTSRETALELDDATTGSISALKTVLSGSGAFVSIADAIKYAAQNGGVDLSVGISVAASNYARDVNVPAGAGQSIASPHSIDMNTPSGVDTFIFLNGRLLYGGSAATNNDVYVGDTAANGDLKFDFPGGIKSGDVIISVQLAQ